MSLSILIAASLACSLPGITPEPTSAPEPAVETASTAPEPEALWEKTDNASYEVFLNALAASSEAAGTLEYKDVAGSARVTFTADGTLSSELNGFGFTL